MSKANYGIKISNITDIGKTAKDMCLFDLAFFNKMHIPIRVSTDKIIIAETTEDDAGKETYTISAFDESSGNGATPLVLGSDLHYFRMQIIQISLHLYLVITFSGEYYMEPYRTIKTLKLLYIDWDNLTNKFSTSVKICEACSGTVIEESFLYPAIYEGNNPTSFMLVRCNHNLTTDVKTFYCSYLYVNTGNNTLTFQNSSGNISWTNLGNTVTYDFNIIDSSGTGIPACDSFAYIIRRTLSNGATTAYYLPERNAGILTKNIDPAARMFRIYRKLSNNNLLLEYGNQSIPESNYGSEVGYLDTSTGKITVL